MEIPKLWTSVIGRMDVSYREKGHREELGIKKLGIKKKRKKFGFGYIKFEAKEKHMKSILTWCSHVYSITLHNIMLFFFFLLFKYLIVRCRSSVSCTKRHIIFSNFIVNLIVIIRWRHRLISKFATFKANSFQIECAILDKKFKKYIKWSH